MASEGGSKFSGDAILEHAIIDRSFFTVQEMLSDKMERLIFLAELLVS